MTEQLTTLQARRIALGAQGFTKAAPTQPSRRHLNQVVDRLGFFQIDSVNVLTRAHLMPLYSRLGAYDTELVHRAYGRAPRRLVEYWAHEAALLDVALYPAMRFRMESDEMWGGIAAAGRDNPELVAWALEEVRARGPITAREMEIDLPRNKDHWGWNWSLTKLVLEFLFYRGLVTSARRNSAFERVYDLPERVLPAEVLAAAPLDSASAHRQLVLHAARAHGVGTEQCLRDYFRLKPGPTRLAVAELVEAGELMPVGIRGWNRPAYLHREAARPRVVRARALLSPFDPLVFERTRTEQLFGFRYRIEIYVPEGKRVHGYYVLPFLLGDSLVARVDLKADRARGTLVVKAAFVEPGAPAHTASELAAELHVLAGWLGLDDVEPPARGDFAVELSRALESL
ncbi:MAG: hypothetical protein JWP10_1964 [Nocardioidaceae bacterium]|nr:hypothetical protein [Nocardioidaceae bacterium]